MEKIHHLKKGGLAENKTLSPKAAAKKTTRLFFMLMVTLFITSIIASADLRSDAYDATIIPAGNESGTEMPSTTLPMEYTPSTLQETSTTNEVTTSTVEIPPSLETPTSTTETTTSTTQSISTTQTTTSTIQPEQTSSTLQETTSTLLEQTTTSTTPEQTTSTLQESSSTTETTSTTLITETTQTTVITETTSSTTITLPPPPMETIDESLFILENNTNETTLYQADAGSFNVKFKGENLEDGIELSSGDATLKFKPKTKKKLEIAAQPKDKTKKKLRPEKNKIKYNSLISDGIDLEYETQPDTLKERITIQDYQSVKEFLENDELAIEFNLNLSDNTYISLDGQTEWNSQPLTTSGKIYIMRKPQSGILYADYNPFTILEPYATDATNQTTTLTYTLTKENNQTKITLHTPQKYLKKAAYPIVLDPTIIVDSPKNMFLWQNTMHCNTDSSSAANCNGIQLNPSIAWFKVNSYCYSKAEGVAKPIFRFNITCIPTAKIASAKLYYQGSCVNQANMTFGDSIGLWRIRSFSGTPTCTTNYNAVHANEMVILMYQHGCKSGRYSVDITANLTDAKKNNDPYIAFKADIKPPLQNTEQPGCTNCGYSYNLAKGGTQLYINYTLNCLHTSECGGCSPEYCGANGRCADKKNLGADCTQADIDGSRATICNPSRICVQDTYDNAGDWYCAYAGQCTYNSGTYNNGYSKCDTPNSYRQCSNGLWAASQPCAPGYACTEGTGCNPLPNLRITSFNIQEVTA